MTEKLLGACNSGIFEFMKHTEFKLSPNVANIHDQWSIYRESEDI